MTTYRFKWFINYDKEEKWLESMAEQGYHLENPFFGYTFRCGQPEQTIIKIDYRTFKNNNDFLDYRTLFEDSGWKHIAGTKYNGAQYFKKIKNSGDDDNVDEDIFSDSSSRAGRYKRISHMWLYMAVTYMAIFLPMTLNFNFGFANILNFKELYLTPGLWEMTGFKFWRQFLFETPFALGRGFMGWFLLLFWIFTIFSYLLFAYKSWRLAKKTMM